MVCLLSLAFERFELELVNKSIPKEVKLSKAFSFS